MDEVVVVGAGAPAVVMDRSVSGVPVIGRVRVRTDVERRDDVTDVHAAVTGAESPGDVDGHSGRMGCYNSRSRAT